GRSRGWERRTNPAGWRAESRERRGSCTAMKQLALFVLVLSVGFGRAEDGPPEAVQETPGLPPAPIPVPLPLPGTPEPVQQPPTPVATDPATETVEVQEVEP